MLIYFTNQFDDLLSDFDSELPILKLNEIISNRADIIKRIDSHLPWLKFFVEEGGSESIAIGATLWRAYGELQVSIFYPKGGGVEVVHAVAQAIMQHLKNKEYKHNNRYLFIKNKISYEGSVKDPEGYFLAILKIAYKRDFRE